MAYTVPWNSNTPPGSDPANHAATDMRAIKLSVQERMEDKFVVDMTADPIVVQPEILGNVTGKSVFIHWSDLEWDTVPTGTKTDAEIKTNSAGTFIGRCSVRFAFGTTITEIRAFMEGDGTLNSTVELIRHTYANPPVDTVLATLTRSANTVAEQTASGLAETSGDGLVYLVKVTLRAGGSANDAGILTIKIIYNSTDSTTVL